MSKEKNLEQSNMSDRKETFLFEGKLVERELADNITQVKPVEGKLADAISDLSGNLHANQKDIDPAMQKIVNDNFFDLIG